MYTYTYIMIYPAGGRVQDVLLRLAEGLYGASSGAKAPSTTHDN